MKIFIYPTENLLFEWPYFEECTKVQDLYLQELKSCETIEEADLAFFPLMLGSAIQHQKSPHSILSKQPNLQYEWRMKWSKLIKNSSSTKHFVLLSYVLFAVNLSFIPSNFTILCYENEVTLDIHGTLGNFGCFNRMMTIPYFIDTTIATKITDKEKTIDICFIGSHKHATKYRDPLLGIFPQLKSFEPSKDVDYLSLYSKSKLGLVLRGDTPTRAAFYQCLLSCCCPIIYKHSLMFYKNLYGGILPIEDLCLVIPNMDFDKPITTTYINCVQSLIDEYLINNEKQLKFTNLCMKYKHYIDYSAKKEGLSAPIYYALESIYKNHKKLFQEPIVFIAQLGEEYNTKYIPTIISSRDTVIGNLKSQYELEIYWHRFIKSCLVETHCIENAQFVFIPFYTFLSGWKDSQFSNERIITKLNFLIDHIASWKTKLNLPHVLIYSDVCWDTSDSFINLINWPSNTVLVSLESISSKSGIKMITSPYLTGFDYNNNWNKLKTYKLIYIGRMRIPFKEEDLTIQKPNCQWLFFEMQGWKSINEIDFDKQCYDLYSQSEFSLQPPGDRETRRGFFQSLIHGCIPVIFKDNIQGYQQHTNLLIEDLCIVVPYDAKDCTIEFIIDFVSSISNTKIKKIKHNIKKNIQNYIFHEFYSRPIFNIIKKIIS